MSTSGESSVRSLIEAHAKSNGDAVAITAPGRAPLTYARFLDHTDRAAAALAAAGITCSDRVAVVLPNGPEMAAAFFAVASCATCAPLNLGYRAEEFDFYLRDLDAKALIVLAGTDSPSVDVAKAHGIPLIELLPATDAPAGTFTLETAHSPSAVAATDPSPHPDDVALVLHTSGTTSRPKMVPLTHTNITTSARNVARALALTPSDRCLNMMPLFHIHGIVGAMLSSVAAGAAVICTEGFLAPRFFDWIDQCRPSWYSAVPTMHQAILQRAPDNLDTIKRCPLRLIRSSSSAMPPQVMADLERVFGAPLIESYGMTEAAHQMASSPLPPAVRKPGSVGVAAGPDIAIMDKAGLLLPRPETGEIVIRGPNVTNGYEHNPDANETAFTNGWFRTGDEGHFDDDDYLYITGRIKEIINRAGEKISPREIDEVLLDHPGVAQIVTFALPDVRLGEDVAAAVVPAEGASLSEAILRDFAAEHLADFKVPRRIIFLDEIPKGPTGKLQRIGLAEKLGLTGATGEPAAIPDYVPPRSPLEEKLADMWAEELGVEKVGIRDDFFRLGGYSLLAARLFHRIYQTLGKRLPLTVLFEAPTIELLAPLVSESAPDYPSIVPIRKGRDDMVPLFCIANADAFIFAGLAELLDPAQPLYGLHPLGITPPENPHIDITELAANYIQLIQAVQPHGPYLLAGKCSSGVVAYEMAQQLRQEKQKVALLVLIDTPGPYGPADHLALVLRRIRRFAGHMHSHFATLRRLPSGKRAPYVRQGLQRLTRRFSPRFASAGSAAPEPSPPIEQLYWRSLKYARVSYKPQAYDGGVVLFLTPENLRRPGSGRGLKWRDLARDGAKVHYVNGVHAEMLHQPLVTVITEHLTEYLKEAQEAQRDENQPRT